MSAGFLCWPNHGQQRKRFLLLGWFYRVGFIVKGAMLITGDSYITVPGTIMLFRVPDRPAHFAGKCLYGNLSFLQKKTALRHYLPQTLFPKIYAVLQFLVGPAFGNNRKQAFYFKFLCLQQHWMNRIGVYSHPHFFRS
jgi:hypothetical protein